MTKIHKILVFISLCGLIFYSSLVANDTIDTSVSLAKKETEPSDESLRYPISQSLENAPLTQHTNAVIDLPSPQNIASSIEYDPLTEQFIFSKKLNDQDLITPTYLTPEEYSKYQMQQSVNAYWRTRNRQEKDNEKPFSLTDIQIGLGDADKIFGPGGVQLKLQGSAELLFGLKFYRSKNPSLSERLQSPPPVFDFDQKIQLNVNGSVGDKMSFGLNYDTEATFDFDQSMLKLRYEGKEDDIIRKIEAGNVSMPLSGSLITGNTTLFGFKTEMQFGKLNVTTVLSQQESESKTINLSGGAQTTDFDIAADQYDENRHFFLAHYFRDNYDSFMSKLPHITSGIVINKIEVWITNKNAVDFNQARNIVGFMDLAEPTRINNTHWIPSATTLVPDNDANSLYREVIGIDGYRTISLVNNALGQSLSGFGIVGGEDYVKIESARRLEPTEYSLNKQLGFISLRRTLGTDEVLAVAYEYTYNGKVYQVGEFSTDGIESPNVLTLKLLKGVSQSPNVPMWDLMMKNVYSLGAFQVQKDKFRLDVMYRSDSTGVDLNYIPKGKIANTILLRVMNLDRLDSRSQQNPDGVFDFVENFTVIPENGRIIFPVVEPFGSHLRKAFDDDVVANEFVFQELYDSTIVVAKEVAEKNKFRLVGQYRSSSGSEIRLNAMNVPQGSVKVTAGGRQLTENTDYTVDYMMGVVNILNQDIIESGTPISINLENKSLFSMQRKTLVGTHLDYAFSDKFNVGGTFMHLSEKPLTQKVLMGNEPISNTIWGLNTSYTTQSQWLTNLLDKIPLLNLTEPSSINLNAEFAQMIPGHSKTIDEQGIAYLDDFESTKIAFDIRHPQMWGLASTPYHPTGGLFPEAALVNDIEYGKNRALLAWYYIDPIFTRNTSRTPLHIKNDKEQLSNHFVREIREREIFPNRQLLYGQSGYIQTLNVAYYPTERGPYNIYPTSYDSEGKLTNPKGKWGGMMRRLETTDFENNNIEYMEFWLLDPFVYDTLHVMKGGDLYVNLGDVSEDILKDGRKFFENGLPVTDAQPQAETTNWGKVPSRQAVVYAFDNEANARKLQDVGLNGLTTNEEFTFGAYQTFINQLKATLTPEALQKFENDPFSPLNDPAGDNFSHYRSSYYDNQQKGVLERYKRYNGTEGNSPAQADTNEDFTTSATNLPDVEDINNDNTLNEYEKYYQYKVPLRPEEMVVGKNYIADVVTSTVELKNGKTEQVKWYQFKIPIRDAQNYTAIGGIRDFKSIRFMRMFLTDFEEDVMLRFATLQLVKGQWKTYTKELYSLDKTPTSTASISMSAVNIEENADKTPVNYVLPPGVSRVIDPSQQQIRQDNEQALSMRILQLSPGDARAVYKTSGVDMRQYKRMQMFVHAEALADNTTQLVDNEMRVFIRLGSDFRNNYYEYEIPLTLTPPGNYSTNKTSDRETVWPSDNMFDFPLELLTDLKIKRNQEKNRTGSVVSNTTPYYQYDPTKPSNKMTIVGNPNLGEVEVIMIGVRNSSRDVKSAEVWVNELRLTEFNEEGGIAALANLGVNLSDFGRVNVSGRVETVGFGGIEQNVMDRRIDDYYEYNVSSVFDMGRFFPQRARVRLPIAYSYAQQVSSPQYNPLDKDVLLEEALDAAELKTQRDSIRDRSLDVVTNQSISVSNATIGIKSKTPMPYDPANVTVNYAYSETERQNPTTERDIEQNYRASLVYDYSWNPKPVEPFAESKLFAKPAWQLIRDINFYYAPNKISFNTSMVRYYYEQKLRNLTDNSTPNLIPTSFQKEFMWNTNTDIRWDLTRSIKIAFTSGNQARITENDGGVNKKLYPDEYEAWKDSVLTSILQLGNPYSYNQRINASWVLPFSKIPSLNWITSNVKYTGSYNWEYGTVIDDQDLGSTIYNQGAWNVDGRFNFEMLYNKSKYLREINRKYGSSRPQPTPQSTTAPKKFEQIITLKKGEKVVVQHNLNDLKPIVKNLADGKVYSIRYTTIDANSLSFVPQTDGEVSLAFEQRSSQQPDFSTQTLAYSSRFLMMLRNMSFTYNETEGTSIYGFKPGVTLFGLDKYNGRMAPGWDFVFGLQDENFVNRAMANDWLVLSNALNPAVYKHTQEFQIRALVEPIAGFKINIVADRVEVKDKQVQFSYADMPSTVGGNFSMSYLAIATAFSSIADDGSFTSDVYNQFVQNRALIAARLEEKRQGTLYPDKGFISDASLGNSVYDPTISSYSLNSPDVLIPAFLAAYSGADVRKVSLSPFASFWNLMPNWQVSYDGLSRIAWINDNFRSVNLRHAYSAKYTVGAFTSYLTYVGDSEDNGYIKDVLTGNPIASSQYSISSVSINELFNPLIGIDLNMKNSLSTKVEIRKGRNLVLNLASNQLVETLNDEIVVGMGYKISDFDVILRLQSNQQKKVKNDLNLRADFSIRDNKTIVRKIEEAYAQATSGNMILSVKFLADYVFSERINISFYYDLQANNPVVMTSYPISNSNVGFSVKMLLTR